MGAHFLLAGIAALLFVANSSIAQQTDDAIAPFVDEGTLVVMRAELAPIDPNAVLDWLVASVQEEGLDPARRDMLRRWWKPYFDKWGGLPTGARDGGVKRAYWLLTLQDVIDPNDCGGVWVFPIEGATDAQKVIDHLHARELQARRIGDVIVASKPGRPPQPGRAGALPPAWAQALSAGRDAPIQIAIVPTAILRKSFEENVPSLPSAGGSAPITILTRGMQWIGLSVSLPPGARVRMVLQAPDARAAQAIANLVVRALPDVRAHKAKLLPVLPAPADLADVLKPTVAADQVRWEPDFQRLVMPVIAREITQAVRQRSTMNIKYILQGFVMYANNHKGETPPDLNALIKDQDMSPEGLVDPLNPKEKVGYVYIRPLGDWQKSDGDVAVIYESTPEGLNVGYADGHVESWDTRQQVEEQVKAAEARNRTAAAGKK